MTQTKWPPRNSGRFKAARALYPMATASTRNRQVIAPARAVINHAANLGWCHQIRVRHFPATRTKRVTVDRNWIDAFLAQADFDNLPHLAAAVLFMWQTGARVGEVVRVLPQHVDLRRLLVVLEQTKTSNWETCHITRELADRLERLQFEGAAPLFRYSRRFGITNRMKAVCRRAGIPYVSPHQAGRHSYATNALEMGANVREVMEGGRWKSARLVLETYAHAEGGGRSIADRFDAKLAQTDHRPSQRFERKGVK